MTNSHLIDEGFHDLELLKKVVTQIKEDDLIDEITTATGWCIKSIDYEIQLK